MITSRLGFETAAAGRTGVAISRNPATELRVGTHKCTAHIGRDPVIVHPSAVHHVAHRIYSFPMIDSYQNHGRRKSRL
jgi:hypothetical protein